MALGMGDAAVTVEAELRALPLGAGLDALVLLFENTDMDGDEAMAAINGLVAGVPSPLTGVQYAAVMIAAAIGVRAGYEVGRAQ